ncbi:MAG: ATP-dependent acyl-CoA ligase [Acidobacteria bacterium]|nr:ATP-dependent acyl-CoA ligase [Acidobacteriota bacterium]
MQYKGLDITAVHLTTRDLMRNASRTHRDQEYLSYVPRGSADTFGQFEEKVNRISNLLVEDYGVRQGDKICTMADTMPELLYCIMAITNIGALWVPVNSLLVGESLKYIITNSDAAFVCAGPDYLATVQGILDRAHRPARLISIAGMAAAAAGKSPEYESPARPDDMSMIIFTSGTTGFPKGVLHTHNSYIRTAVRGLEALGTDSSHRIHLYLPFSHGWAYLLMLGGLYYKCSLILEDRFHRDSYWQTIERYRITQDHWTGTVPLNLMKLPKTAFEASVELGVIGTFGALYDTMKERWPNIRFHSLYGTTEHPFMTEVPPDDIKPGSDGIPKYPDEILIMDDEGRPVPQGEVGEIVCRCRCGVVMRGYYKDAAASARSLRDGDMYTGDLGYTDAEGHLRFAGRKKDALRVRGEMVSVEHIEHIINTNPGIAESAVVGYRPPEKEALKEDEIVAHLVLQKGAQMTPEEFRQWAGRNLARFMVPRYIRFRDSLPKTATERVQRFKLREEGIAGATKLF